MLLCSVNGIVSRYRDRDGHNEIPDVILPRFSEEFHYPVVLFLIQTLTPQVAQDILGARIIVSFKQ